MENSNWQYIPGWSDGISQVPAEQFRGESCFVAIEFASRTELAAKAKLFRRGNNYHCFLDYYVSRAALRNPVNRDFHAWHEAGHLKVSEGEFIDLAHIAQDVRQDREQFNVREIAHDPWQSPALVAAVNTGWLIKMPFVEFRPSVANFSPAMKELEVIVHQGRLRHLNDHILQSMLMAVEAKSDRHGNLYPTRLHSQRIDGALALLMALGRFMAADVSQANSQELTARS